MAAPSRQCGRKFVVEYARWHGFRWVRAAARAAVLLVGAVQCLLAVVFGVGLLAGIVSGADDGPTFVLEGLLLEVLLVVLFLVGLLGLISALEQWSPPGDRWNGLRWQTLGLSASVVALISWGVATWLFWPF